MIMINLDLSSFTHAMQEISLRIKKLKLRLLDAAFVTEFQLN